MISVTGSVLSDPFAFPANITRNIRQATDTRGQQSSDSSDSDSTRNVHENRPEPPNVTQPQQIDTSQGQSTSRRPKTPKKKGARPASPAAFNPSRSNPISVPESDPNQLKRPAIDDSVNRTPKKKKKKA